MSNPNFNVSGASGLNRLSEALGRKCHGFGSSEGEPLNVLYFHYHVQLFLGHFSRFHINCVLFELSQR